MTRRDLLAGAAGATLSPLALAQAPAMTMDEKKPLVAFVYDDFATLDLVGALSFLSMHGNVRTVAKGRRTVTSADGLKIQPDHGFADCPKEIDLLIVPGGSKGTIRALEDPATMGFLATHGARATRLVSVCTGAALLGAAGLLKGKRATTHWAIHSLLQDFGATAVHARYVHDGRLWTAAGVTAGLDLGLAMVAELYGEPHARLMQLAEEYDPAPPFDAGTPKKAAPATIREVEEHTRTLVEAVRKAARRMT